MSRRVLVVDDEKLIVKGIRFSLEQDGYDVDCAYDGEEALKLAKENAYDIILLMSCFRNMTVLKCVSRSGNIRMFRSLCLQQKATIWIRSWDWIMEQMIT